MKRKTCYIASLEFWKDIHFGGAIFFIKVAVKCLLGKMAIIDTKQSWSKGGYSYQTILISKLPVSAVNKYEF